MVTRWKTRFQILMVAVVAALATGCGGGRYPVSGRVEYDDGSPVDSGTVIAEAIIDGKPVGIQGNIGPDGRFAMGGDKPGDGALPGTYKVLLMPRALGDSELAEGKRPAFSGKYGKFESSGFTMEVKADKNEFVFKVAKPKPKGE
jgi:hypothetical protein